MSIYTLSSRADLDLNEIWLFIAEHSVVAADRIEAELHRAMRQLADKPSIGHRHAFIRDPAYLVYTVEKYLIIYLPHFSPMHVVRVLHGARDLSSAGF